MPIDALRPALKPVGKNPGAHVHPGLWLDRFLSLQTEQNEKQDDNARQARDALIQHIDNKEVDADYRAALQAWKSAFADHPAAVLHEATSLGRVVVGLGQKNPAEFGITLHRTWGVPILPGSSLKGIASLGADRYLASESWRRREDSATARAGTPNLYDALFGDVDEVGAVIFHDAWLVPEDKRNGLHRDVMTVHHPDYYQRSDAPYTDTESPIPVPFVSAKGKFLVVLELHPSVPPDQTHWLEAAWTCLRLGLSRHGVGSKTNAGYGRVDLPDFKDTEFGNRAAKEAEQRAKEERQRLEREAEAERARKGELDRQRAADQALEVGSAVFALGPEQGAQTLVGQGSAATLAQVRAWLEGTAEPTSPFSRIPREPAWTAAIWRAVGKLPNKARENLQKELARDKPKLVDEILAAVRNCPAPKK